MVGSVVLHLPRPCLWDEDRTTVGLHQEIWWELGYFLVSNSWDRADIGGGLVRVYCNQKGGGNNCAVEVPEDFAALPRDRRERGVEADCKLREAGGLADPGSRVTVTVTRNVADAYGGRTKLHQTSPTVASWAHRARFPPS